MLAYRLLVWELGNGSLNEWRREKLVTIGEACRMLLSESTRKMVTWVLEELNVTLNGQTGKSLNRLLGRLGLTSY